MCVWNSTESRNIALNYYRKNIIENDFKGTLVKIFCTIPMLFTCKLLFRYFFCAVFFNFLSLFNFFLSKLKVYTLITQIVYMTSLWRNNRYKWLHSQQWPKITSLFRHIYNCRVAVVSGFRCKDTITNFKRAREFFGFKSIFFSGFSECVTFHKCSLENVF